MMIIKALQLTGRHCGAFVAFCPTSRPATELGGSALVRRAYPMKFFVSSTYVDLTKHRAAVNEVLIRMKNQFAAMEYFGSRGDDARTACFKEIEGCDILVGIYAWRYGWQPTPSGPSITEQEFDYAMAKNKKCLCYVVDEAYPWLPAYIDQGDAATRLGALKGKIGKQVRSKFTTPDNLAKQVAADLARELSHAPSESFGGLLRVNWDIFAPELQTVLATAYSQARQDSRAGVVSTRHVIAALASLPNSGQPVVTAFPNVELPTLDANIRKAEVAELFSYDRPLSNCVLGSMKRLLPKHSTTEQLLAIELAVDLLKNGRGGSVAKYRQAGVDGAAVERVESHIRRIAADSAVLERGLRELTDAEIIHLAYVTSTPLSPGLIGESLRAAVLQQAEQKGVSLFLAGEMLRRHPRLVGL
jgi:hypothetical protein